MNTGAQKSSSTPHFARTGSTPAGKTTRKKNLTEIMAAHGVPYVATAERRPPRRPAAQGRQGCGDARAAPDHAADSCLDGWGLADDGALGAARLAVASGAFRCSRWKTACAGRSTPAPTRLVADHLALQRRYRNCRRPTAALQGEIDEGWARLVRALRQNSEPRQRTETDDDDPGFLCLRLGALMLALAASAAARAQDKLVELRFAHWLPAQHSLAKTGFEPWAKAVEAASGGSIKVTMYLAQQLGKAPDHYDMARDGIADMTWVSPGYQAGRFPLFAASELPFMMANPGGGSAALDAWYRRHAGTEMKDVRLCMAHIHNGTLHSKEAHHRAGPDQGHEDPPGQRHGGADGHAAGRHQRAGVGARIARCAGEGRGRRHHLPLGFADQLRHRQGGQQHIDFRLYAASFVWVMNPGFYDKLSAGQKKVIDAHCNNEWAGKVGVAWGGWEDGGEGKIEKMGGHTITRLSPAQRRRLAAGGGADDGAVDRRRRQGRRRRSRRAGEPAQRAEVAQRGLLDGSRAP